MIDLDALRTALHSSQPASELDRLVRAELAAGRLTKQVRSELIGLEDKVWGEIEGNEAAEDALRDTIDALAGFCPAKYAYHNPPVLPTEEEIAELPRWARVAFLARCAKRVVNQYKAGWPEAPDEQFNRVVRTVRSAENVAAQLSRDLPIEMIWDEKTQRSRVQTEADLALHASRTANKPTASHAAMAAAHAGHAAIDPGENTTHLGTISGAVLAAGNDDLIGVIRRDFDHLATLARWQHWADDTPVPPEVFGPLWPEGPPKGWPADEATPTLADLPLSIEVRVGVIDQVVVDEVLNLFHALNRYHIARTGVRLTLEGDIYTRLTQLAGVGV